MVYFKSLFVALAAASTVAASPCKPSTTNSVPDTTTTTVGKPTSIETSSLSETTTDIIETTTTVADDATTASTQTSAIVETTTAADDTTTAHPTTTTAEADITTTTTTAETTSAAVIHPQCGITGAFASSGNTASYIATGGAKNSVKDCLQACQDYTGCEVVAFYDLSLDFNAGLCQFYTGDLKTDGQETIYKWYELGCLAGIDDTATTTAVAATATETAP